MPSFPARAMQGWAAMPQRTAQVRRSEATGSAGCRTTEPKSAGRPRSLEGARTKKGENGLLMIDLMCGPNMPLAKAFLFCGWRVLPIDWSLDPGHDLSNPLLQGGEATKSMSLWLPQEDVILAFRKLYGSKLSSGPCWRTF